MIGNTEAERLRQVLIDYLKGASLETIEQNIRACVAGEKSGYNLYHNKLFAATDTDKPGLPHPQTILFLKLLEIDQSNTDFNILISLNLYQMLTRLKGRHNRLEKLIEIIDSVHEPQNIGSTLLRLFLITTGIGIFLYFNPSLLQSFLHWFLRVSPKWIDWLVVLFTDISSVAIIGISWQSFVLLYKGYRTFEHGPYPSIDDIKSLFFKIIAVTLNITANILMLLAHGTLGHIAAFLFIVSSAIDVIETIYFLQVKYGGLHIDLTNQPPNRPENSLQLATISIERKANNLSHNMLRERDVLIFWIKLAAAAFITVSIVLWCTMPPQIFLSLGFLTFGLIVNFLKDLFISEVKHRHAQKLQNQIKIIYDEKRYEQECLATFDVFYKVNKWSEIASITKEYKSLRSQSPFNLEKAQQILRGFADGYAAGLEQNENAEQREVVNCLGK